MYANPRSMGDAADRKARKKAAFEEIARDLEAKALAANVSDEMRDAALRVRAVAMNAARQLEPRDPKKSPKKR